MFVSEVMITLYAAVGCIMFFADFKVLNILFYFIYSYFFVQNFIYYFEKNIRNFVMCNLFDIEFKSIAGCGEPAAHVAPQECLCIRDQVTRVKSENPIQSWKKERCDGLTHTQDKALKMQEESMEIIISFGCVQMHCLTIR